jgi:hypothetical protein
MTDETPFHITTGIGEEVESDRHGRPVGTKEPRDRQQD